MAPHPEQTDPSVRLLVQSLPERLRVPILLHYYADMPIREVAALTGRKEGTVKSDVHRLKRRFAALVREEIANTVASSSEVEEELRHLRSVLAANRS